MSEKEQRARETVRRYMWWTAGGASIPVPLVDLVVVTGAQMKMLAELSGIYGLPFQKVRVKALVGSLVGFALQPALSTGLLSSVLKGIPGAGALLGTPGLVLVAGAYTWALGRVFIQHFESGGTLLDFDPEAVREHFRTQLAEGSRAPAPSVGAGVSERASARG